MYDEESSPFQAMMFNEQQVEFGYSPPVHDGPDDYFDVGINLDSVAYTYAFVFLVAVVPFVLHVVVGCFGLVQEYFKCFKVDLFRDVTTRARRREFIGFQLTRLAVLYDLVLLDTILDFGLLPMTVQIPASLKQQVFVSPGYFTLAYYIFTLVPLFSLKIRRLHDIGRSGWWVLLEFFPVVSIVPVIMMWIVDSQTGTNAYGANPKGKVHPEGLSTYLRNADADILEEGLVTFRTVDGDNKREHLLPQANDSIVQAMGYAKVSDSLELSKV
jgi:uncharacterized membrane protein YhaH (DUF805 family)